VTIAVVGAGIVGCAVGFELAQRGFHVELFDMNRVGGGATHATAGVLAPFIEAPAAGPLHDLTVESFRLYDQFVSQVRETSGVAVEYRRCGTLELAETADDEERLRAGARLARASGFQAEWSERRLPAGSGATARGLLIPSQGYVRVEQLLTAMRSGIEARGGRFTEGQGVQRIEPSETRVILQTGTRRVDSDAVIIAAGSWSDSLGGEPVGVRPVRGQLVRLRWSGPPLEQVLWTHDCYVVPWIDGTLLVGATVEDVGFDNRVTVDGVAALLRAVARLLPDSADATFLEARSGLRPASSDGLPVIRPSRRSARIIYATGHYRNGILLAPVTARRVADLIQAIV
jgi:glycine oxidase